MKKTTYLIIALLLTIIIGETVFIFLVRASGSPRDKAHAECPENTTTVIVRDKVVINLNHQLWYAFDVSEIQDPADPSLMRDSVYQTDTIVLVAKDNHVTIR